MIQIHHNSNLKLGSRQESRFVGHMVMSRHAGTYGTIDAAAQATSRGKTILGGSIGHFIEWYDWSIYGFLAAIFANQMFPAGSAAASMIASFSAFAIGFLGRPIGAFMLCPLADKYGRRDLLSATILMSGVGSLMIGLCPTYEQIGIAAPLLIVAARLLQGISTGGEAQIAVAFLNEHAPSEHRAFAASPQFISIGLAVLGATAAASLTTYAFPQDALVAWGWRVPFLLGAAASAYGLVIRRSLQETPSFRQIRAKRRVTMSSVFSTLARHPKEGFIVFLMQMSSVQYYLWLVFLPTYATMVGDLDSSLGLLGNIAALITYCAGIPLFAWMSDRIGRKLFLIVPSAGFVLLTYPLLSLLQGDLSFDVYLIVALSGALLISMSSAAGGTVLAELFPTSVRASGIGIPYAICSALFGGTAPLVTTWLHGLGGVAYVSAYVAGLTAIVLVTCIFLVPETRGRSLN